jgi:hypothetical protein
MDESVEDAGRETTGDYIAGDANVQPPPPNRPEDLGAGLLEVAGEHAQLPEFDFSSGETGEKVRRLREKLIEQGLIPSPAEGIPEPQPSDHPASPEAGPLLGKDVDWDEFDLDPNFAHFYPQAQFTVTGQGPKWVVVLDEYASFERPYNRTGVDKVGDPCGLGAFITSKVNSPPEMGTGPWKMAALLPGTMGNGAVVLTRKVPIVLPDPKFLQKETKVDAPSEGELEKTNEAATKWAEGESGSSLAEQIAKEVIEGPDVEPEDR